MSKCCENQTGEPYFQKLFAERIGGEGYGKGTAIYKFEKIKRAKRAALELHPERALLDFGIGENDETAPVTVQQVMQRELGKLENRGYADNGILEYKEAAAQFMKREFDLQLDPVTEINHCIGTKSALAILPLAFINPGDITLMTVPGYPVAGTYTKYCGGEVYPMQLREENGFLPDLEQIPDAIRERAKLLVLNYPNSPTGRVVGIDFFERVVEFAKRHKIVVIQDAAHGMLSYQQAPVSFLQAKGAKDVGVELHSMSKGFHMIGWRLGFVAGNERLVRAFSDIKDNTDSGQFIAIQKAASAALLDPEIPKQVRKKYERRLSKLVKTLNGLGFKAEMPGGTYFLYVKAPTGVQNKGAAARRFSNAEEVSQFLITERSVCTVPWDDAGAFLRWSVTYLAEDEAAEDRLMAEISQRLSSDSFSWE